jgi:protocatechuate 3,4-dioxygenase beta subunit
VVFQHGYVLRVESYRVEGDEARMELPAGGAVWFPLAKIARVVAHEVDLTPEERLLPAMDLGLGEPNAAPASATRASRRGTSHREEVDPAELDPAHSISGRVLDEAGEPADGIELTARPIRLFQAPQGLPGMRPEAQTRSASDGSYRFGQLDQGEYGIRTLDTDRYAAAQTVVRTGVDFANVVVSEKRKLLIYGSVTNNEGEPLPGVTVTAKSLPYVPALTEQNGDYTLEISVAGLGRTYTLEFELEGYRQQTRTLLDDQISGRSQVQVDARLQPITRWATVAGKVSDSDGLPISGETVSLVGPGIHQTVTDDRGQFSIPEVGADAEYEISVRPRGPYEDYSEEVRVSAEGLTVGIVLESLRYGSLSGRMIDLNGNPVPHFSLWLRSGNGSAQQPLLVSGDGTGHFSVPKAPLGSVSFATISNPQLAITGLDLSSGGAENVALILDRGGYEVRGRVVDGHGNPVAAPRVTLQWSHQGNGLQSRSLRRSSADANGFFTFTNVGPGAHSLSVSAPGFDSSQLEVESPGDLVVQLRGYDEEKDSRGK